MARHAGIGESVNRPGDYNKMHTHPGTTWSGVYYIDTGDNGGESEGTPLYLSDPAPARTNIFFPQLLVSNVMIRPAPGFMVLFPGYLQHGVMPHKGDRLRISGCTTTQRSARSWRSPRPQAGSFSPKSRNGPWC